METKELLNQKAKRPSKEIVHKRIKSFEKGNPEKYGFCLYLKYHSHLKAKRVLSKVVIHSRILQYISFLQCYSEEKENIMHYTCKFK